MLDTLLLLGLPIGFFLSAMGLLKSHEMLIDIIHAKRGEFKIFRIKPNMRVIAEWRKYDKGFLVKGKKQDDKIPYNEKAGSKLFGGFFGNTPIMYIDNDGNIINFQFTQVYVDVPVYDDKGDVTLDDKKEPITEKQMIYQRKDSNVITSDQIDTLAMISEAHGRLATVTDGDKQITLTYIILGLLAVVVLILGMPMLKGA